MSDQEFPMQRRPSATNDDLGIAPLARRLLEFRKYMETIYHLKNAIREGILSGLQERATWLEAHCNALSRYNFAYSTVYYLPGTRDERGKTIREIASQAIHLMKYIRKVTARDSVDPLDAYNVCELIKSMEDTFRETDRPGLVESSSKRDIAPPAPRNETSEAMDMDTARDLETRPNRTTISSPAAVSSQEFKLSTKSPTKQQSVVGVDSGISNQPFGAPQLPTFATTRGVPFSALGSSVPAPGDSYTNQQSGVMSTQQIFHLPGENQTRTDLSSTLRRISSPIQQANSNALSGEGDTQTSSTGKPTNANATSSQNKANVKTLRTSVGSETAGPSIHAGHREFMVTPNLTQKCNLDSSHDSDGAEKAASSSRPGPSLPGPMTDSSAVQTRPFGSVESPSRYDLGRVKHECDSDDAQEGQTFIRNSSSSPLQNCPDVLGHLPRPNISESATPRMSGRRMDRASAPSPEDPSGNVQSRQPPSGPRGYVAQTMASAARQSNRDSQGNSSNQNRPLNPPQAPRANMNYAPPHRGQYQNSRQQYPPTTRGGGPFHRQESRAAPNRTGKHAPSSPPLGSRPPSPKRRRR